MKAWKPNGWLERAQAAPSRPRHDGERGADRGAARDGVLGADRGAAAALLEAEAELALDAEGPAPISSVGHHAAEDGRAGPSSGVSTIRFKPQVPSPPATAAWRSERRALARRRQVERAALARSRARRRRPAG